VTSFGKHTRPRMHTHAHARVSSCRPELRTPTVDDTTSDSLKIARLLEYAKNDTNMRLFACERPHKIESNDFVRPSLAWVFSQPSVGVT
jgi:hypothetical protein